MKSTAQRAAAVALSLTTVLAIGAATATPVQAFYQPPAKTIYDTPTLALGTSVAVDPSHADPADPSFPSYWGYVDNTGVVAHGQATFAGNPRDSYLGGTIVANPTGKGYWVVDTSNGGVWEFGGAPHFDNLAATTGYKKYPNTPITDAVATPDGNGLLALDQDGHVWTAGTARSFGDLSKKPHCISVASYDAVAIRLNPAATGYWILGAGGEVWGLGADVPSYGDGCHINGPITKLTSMAVTADGRGYWLATLDGRLFARGSAPALQPLQGVKDDLTYVVAAPAGGVLAAREAGDVQWAKPQVNTGDPRPGRPCDGGYPPGRCKQR